MWMHLETGMKKDFHIFSTCFHIVCILYSVSSVWLERKILYLYISSDMAGLTQKGHVQESGLSEQLGEPEMKG